MSACVAFEYSSRAVGDAARVVRTEEKRITSDYLRAPGLGADLRSALDALRAALVEHGQQDWDGYGAAPLSREAASHAFRLITLLPIGTPPPEISADPDGEVSLEWCRDRRLVFSVSVSPRGELNYAGLFGINTVHGKESQFDDELPFYVRAGINRVQLSAQRR